MCEEGDDDSLLSLLLPHLYPVYPSKEQKEVPQHPSSRTFSSAAAHADSTTPASRLSSIPALHAGTNPTGISADCKQGGAQGHLEDFLETTSFGSQAQVEKGADAGTRTSTHTHTSHAGLSDNTRQRAEMLCIQEAFTTQWNEAEAFKTRGKMMQSRIAWQVRSSKSTFPHSHAPPLLPESPAGSGTRQAEGL